MFVLVRLNLPVEVIFELRSEFGHPGHLPQFGECMQLHLVVVFLAIPAYAVSVQYLDARELFGFDVLG